MKLIPGEFEVKKTSGVKKLGQSHKKANSAFFVTHFDATSKRVEGVLMSFLLFNFFHLQYNQTFVVTFTTTLSDSDKFWLTLFENNFWLIHKMPPFRTKYIFRQLLYTLKLQWRPLISYYNRWLIDHIIHDLYEQQEILLLLIYFFTLISNENTRNNYVNYLYFLIGGQSSLLGKISLL